MICSKDKETRLDLYVTYLKAPERGGEFVVENGITLCEAHLVLRSVVLDPEFPEHGKEAIIQWYHDALKAKEQTIAAYYADMMDSW